MNEYDKRRISEADRIYGEHVLRSIYACSPGCYAWQIGKPGGGSEFWTQIIVGERGSVIVTGDGPDLIFRFWRNTARPSAAISLIGALATSGVDYLAGKVVAGDSHEFDRKVAIKDLREYCEEQAREIDADGPNNRVEFWHDLHERAGIALDDESGRDEARREIYEFTGCCEVPQFGRVVSGGVVRAAAACRRLLVLLGEGEDDR